MSLSVVFMDRQSTILRVVGARRELKALAPSLAGEPFKRGQLFRFNRRIYRPVDVQFRNDVVKVTLDELLPHQAIAYVLKRQRSAGGE